MALAITQVDHAFTMITEDKEFMQMYSPNRKDGHLQQLWNALLSMSEKQYKYLLALVYNSEHTKLEEPLEGMGSPREERTDPEIINSTSD